MKQADEGAASARALLAERVAMAPEVVAGLPDRFEALEGRSEPWPRTWVTTGIGTSEGHARHLAEVASRWAGIAMRFVPTSAVAARGGSEPSVPPPDEGLIVFSQGLSANARFALSDLAPGRTVILMTGLPQPGAAGFDAVDPEKADWLRWFQSAGGIQVDLGCGSETGLLLRVIGARVGYIAAWRLLGSLVEAELRKTRALDVGDDRLRGAQIRAAERAQALFASHEDRVGFFSPDRPLLIVGEEGSHLWADHLGLKVAEGMMRPAPRMLDVLEFTHGPLQSLASRPASILYLAPAAISADAAADERPWLARFRSTLDPELHSLRVLTAELDAPQSILEYEAMLDAVILALLDDTGLDLSNWPSREREDALYQFGPPLPAPLARPRAALAPVSIEEAVWPEIEAGLAAGRRTAILGLGSVEQHGPHLPLGTDAWIADALAQGLARRVDDGWALPSMPFGCASEHLAFPGTLHVAAETLEALLIDLIDSLRHHGFERLFIFTAHGGNVDALNAMRARLEAAGQGLRVHLDTDLDAVAELQRAASASAGLDPKVAGPHAGEYETSVVAALRRGAVRRDGLEPGVVADAEEAQSLFMPSLRANAESGVVGDPSAADAGRGRAHLERWVEALEAAYRQPVRSSPTAPD